MSRALDSGTVIKKTPNIPAADHAESILFVSIRTLIESARNTVARDVDLVQVYTNFDIGRHIVEFEQQGEGQAEYGTQMLKRLAERLTDEFGSGFSVTNLKLMRQFYALHAQRIGQTSSDQLVTTQNGTLRELRRQFQSGLYECLSADRPQDWQAQAPGFGPDAHVRQLL